MANQEHLDILKQGVDVWNQWRKEHTNVKANLSDANLSDANLSDANLSDADLIGTDFTRATLTGANLTRATLREANLSFTNLNDANLTRADLIEADLSLANLSNANLSEANFSEAHLIGTDLTGADLTGADLTGADLSLSRLSETNLTGANLSDANLSDANLSDADLGRANLHRAILVETDLTRANLTQCSIYGISAWNTQLVGAKQDNLVITRDDEPTITVDNLKVAQFIYLLLNNEEIRDVINTITSKVVLILGRFTPERKVVLDAIREELRKQDYLPVLFDFEKPTNRDFTETVRTLAHLARFIIADLTEPSSMSLELQAIVPDLAVPVQPLFKVSQVSKHEFSMFQDLSKKYHWVLPIYHYTDQASLLQSLKEKVIDPSEIKAQELENR